MGITNAAHCHIYDIERFDRVQVCNHLQNTKQDHKEIIKMFGRECYVPMFQYICTAAHSWEEIIFGVI